MASFSPSFIMAPRTHTKKIETKVFIGQNGDMQPKRGAGDVRIKSSIVFEDRALGIVCYRDEDGEVICEGYDEGPRFYPKASKLVRHKPKEVDIHGLLLNRRIQILEDVDLICIQIGVSVQEED